MRNLFFLLIASVFIQCGSDAPPPPPRPLEIAGTWELTGHACMAQNTSDAVVAMMLLEFGSVWTFESDGQFKEAFQGGNHKGEFITGRYLWKKEEQQLEISGKYFHYFDILYHTNDSMALLNIENAIRYKFKRKTFSVPKQDREKEALELVEMPKLTPRDIPEKSFVGQWKMEYLQNDKTSRYYILEMNEVLKGQQWTFASSGDISIRIGNKAATGKWAYHARTQKLLIDIDGKIQTYRVVSLAQQLFTIESVESEAKMLFKKKVKT